MIIRYVAQLALPKPFCRVLCQEGQTMEEGRRTNLLVLWQVPEGSHGLSNLVENCDVVNVAPTTHESRER